MGQRLDLWCLTTTLTTTSYGSTTHYRGAAALPQLRQEGRGEGGREGGLQKYKRQSAWQADRAKEEEEGQAAVPSE